MALINYKKVKELANDNGKQAGSDFLNALNSKVKEIVLLAIKKANNHKRLTESELI